jgi:hypothetical protein
LNESATAVWLIPNEIPAIAASVMRRVLQVVCFIDRPFWILARDTLLQNISILISAGKPASHPIEVIRNDAVIIVTL